MGTKITSEVGTPPCADSDVVMLRSHGLSGTDELPNIVSKQKGPRVHTTPLFVCPMSTDKGTLESKQSEKNNIVNCFFFFLRSN